MFGKWMACDTIFRKKGTSELLTPYVLRSIAVSLQPGYFEEAEKVRRLDRGYVSCGDKRVSGNAMER